MATVYRPDPDESSEDEVESEAEVSSSQQVSQVVAQGANEEEEEEEDEGEEEEEEEDEEDESKRSRFRLPWFRLRLRLQLQLTWIQLPQFRSPQFRLPQLSKDPYQLLEDQHTQFQLTCIYILYPLLWLIEHHREFLAAHEITTERRGAAYCVALYLFFHLVIRPFLVDIYNCWLFQFCRAGYYFYAHATYIVSKGWYDGWVDGCWEVRHMLPQEAWTISSRMYWKTVTCEGVRAPEKIGMWSIWWSLIKSALQIIPDYYTYHRQDDWFNWCVKVPGFVFAVAFIFSKDVRSKV